MITYPTTIAFDCTLMRPGCVLLQASLGCPYLIAQAFDQSSWLLAPTDDLKVYPLANEDQLRELVRRVEKHRVRKPSGK